MKPLSSKVFWQGVSALQCKLWAKAYEIQATVNNFRIEHEHFDCVTVHNYNTIFVIPYQQKGSSIGDKMKCFVVWLKWTPILCDLN